MLRCAKADIARDLMQPVRGWTAEQWDAAGARLVERGWVGEDGALTAAGRVVHYPVEAATDRLPRGPGTGSAPSAWPRSPTCFAARPGVRRRAP